MSSPPSTSAAGPRDASAREVALASAAAALASGSLVLAATETVYGLFANATDAGAVARLSVRAGDLPAAWHAARVRDVVERLALPEGPHRRAVERLAPGPVTFIAEVDAEREAAITRALGAVEGAAVGRGVVVARVPEPSFAAELLEHTRCPVVGRSIAALGLGDGRYPPELSGARREELGIGAVLEDGPTRYGKGSTLVRLRPGGGVEIEREGALPARRVRALLARRILFVCSGNTCRSPMAAALARDLLGGPEGGFEVGSAGVSAGAGGAMTPEARAALESMGVRAGHHESAGVTRAKLAEADAVFAMTRAHLGAITAIEPGARAMLLDPGGGEIDDPIGGPLEVYIRTAQRMRTLIEDRLRELGP